MDVVILAGAPPLSGSAGTSRAMTVIGGKTMLQWEVDAMRQARTISRIYAVGDVSGDGLDEVIPPVGDFLSNLVAGVSHAAEHGARTVLIATSDIPLITANGIDDFVTRAMEVAADFCYPIAPKAECVRAYPQMRRTYLKVREGVFTGGNMALVSADFVMRNRDVIFRAYESRKSVFKLAGMVGWEVLARVLAAQLVWPAAVGIPTLESAVSRLLNGKLRAIVTSDVEIGEDVDKPEDVAAMEEILAAR